MATFPLKPGIEEALARAWEFVGATAPNPPVGAVAWDSEGRILGVSAHEKAGQSHAEAGLLQQIHHQGKTPQIHTLFVTLEPCNHTGKTPPCTKAIQDSRVPRVIYGVSDPNSLVKGGGGNALKESGVQVQTLSELGMKEEELKCRELIRPWAHRLVKGYPWVVVKQALDPSGSMIPPAGKKTFTSPESLHFAHRLRRQSDAILTGIGTVLADRPLFTVRHLQDHAAVRQGKPRILVVMDRHSRTPRDWIQKAQENGHDVWIRQELEKTLKELGEKGLNSILVEAGPTLTQAVLNSGFCGQHVVIQAQNNGKPDLIQNHVYWNH
ncbi:MAG: bifunctional diaminohydroxyphosphoribosylaminopyrimidine deaminase/5-amino-6-(5-phosphoribosylamino)uracil reductase RibD [Bdellovibrionales bacterium]|nr:bifunctional diaminohydroxyphosphoribosylaminopyrimidine deaminase/5-amino-6-(5-phosphoribosylamino)uracil reductase RibD [Bdellovibrionales bacterium]